MSDFPEQEYHLRLERAQILMKKASIDALLLTREPEFRYFSGFRTAFWLSPSRPWFLIIPQSREPIAVIPEIGVELMQKTWVSTIRSWPSPFPEDEGITLLVDALKPYEKIGVMMGAETHLRMPLADFDRLKNSIKHRCRTGHFCDCTPIIQHLRAIKSSGEIDYISKICSIAGRSFAHAEKLFRIGQPLDEIFRLFRIDLLKEGADDVPYLVGALGRSGYKDIISPPTQDSLTEGDILMLDTGATLNGYFCDFDRNFAFGHPGDPVLMAHEKLWQATQAGLKAAHPGMRACDVFKAMNDVLGNSSGNVGRLGHGLGMQLTEWPSLTYWDQTILQQGMVLTLEPSLTVEKGKMMVTEENILITDDAPKILTPSAAKKLPIFY